MCPSQANEVSWDQARDGWHYRKHVEEGVTEEEPEYEYSKDYDRILYSTAFRRLGGVTQVAASGEMALFHNRLTHALKTAQVGSRIANHLNKLGWATRNGAKQYGGIEPRVVRAACLAHNLGRPPFGHTAVQELTILTNELHNGQSKFSEAAQAFRIVTKLAFREKPVIPRTVPALNLTRGTLVAMLKYPWQHGHAPDGAADGASKWGYYRSEEDIVRWAIGPDIRALERPSDQYGRAMEYRSVEAQILDWADDISYAIHDVEDFFRAGLIPVHDLVDSLAEWDQFFSYAWERKLVKLFGADEKAAVYAQCMPIRTVLLPQEQYEGTQADRIALHFFASNLIKQVTEGTRLKDKGVLAIDFPQFVQIEFLKQLTWHYVINRPSFEALRRGQRALIRSLYTNLVQWVTDVWDGEPLPAPTKGSNRTRRTSPHLPPRLAEYLDIAKFVDVDPNGSASVSGSTDAWVITRAVVDYISSLTELQTVELNARLNGQSEKSLLASWFLP